MGEHSNRLDALERAAADQERTIQDLSDMVAEQWRTLDGMGRRLEALEHRIASLLEVVDAAGGQLPSEP